MASGSSSSSNSLRSATSQQPRPQRQTSKPIVGPWADGPLPLIETPSWSQDITHPALHIANEITHAHNAALRGLNATYLQVPYVTAPQDVSDLLFLTKSWSDWVQSSHNQRQKRMYPEFEAALSHPTCITPRLAAPELDFEPALQRLRQYAEKMEPHPQAHDASALQDLIRDLAPTLRSHALAEVAALMELPALCGPPGSADAERRASRLLQIYLAAEAEASGAQDRFVVPPMVLRMRDTTFEGGNRWPGMSVLAVHAVADRLSGMHAGAWRFLPCDVWGRPRELAFLGREVEESSEALKVGGVGTPVVT